MLGVGVPGVMYTPARVTMVTVIVLFAHSEYDYFRRPDLGAESDPRDHVRAMCV